MPIAIAVCVVLAVVILSDSRVIRAYPNGAKLHRRERHSRCSSGLIRGSRTPYRLRPDRRGVVCRWRFRDLELRARGA